MSHTRAASMAPPAGDLRDLSAATADADHARLIAARLPLFCVLWLGMATVWCAVHVTAGRLDLLAAMAHLIVVAGGFVTAIVASRRNSAGPYVVWIVITACVLEAASSSVLFAYTHGYGEVLGFSHLLLCLMSALMFAWGWRPASVLALGSFVTWWAVQSQLQVFVTIEELWVGYVAGSLLGIALAETSARSLRTLWHHRQAERVVLDELEGSRDAYRDLAENARDQIWLADLEARILYVNEAAARFNGVPASELIGHSVFESITDHPRNPDVKELLGRVIRGETLPPVVCQVTSLSGDIAWHEVVASAVRDPGGKVTGIRGTSRDITERVHAEERLRQSEERFRGAFAQTSVGLTITEPSGRPLQLNDAICTMLGYSREELMRMNIDDVTHPDDRADTHEGRRGLADGERSSFALEKRFIRRDGQIVWGMISVSPLRDAQGTLVAFIALVQDVTERRLSDDALRRSHSELGQSRQKLRRLARQQTAIREEERKRLGFDLHDDVCQHLVGMTIMVESLRQRLAPLSERDGAEFARIAQVASELGDHLRLVAHELRPVLLGDLGLEGSLRSLTAGLSTDVCTIDAHFPTDIPRLDEEVEVGIFRIAQEALSNAIRHSNARGIELMLAVAGESLRLEVCDDGCGFAVAESADGLGLFSMEERAIGLGGRLSVWSEPGAGTTIRLAYPMRAGRAVHAEAANEDPGPVVEPWLASVVGH